MWGRLGMNDDRTSFKLINKPSEWFQLINNNQYVIKHVDASHPDVVQVNYKNLYSEGSTQTSVIHAAFVTAHARLKLYSELEKIGDRVLYFDTDSIIYVDQLYLATTLATLHTSWTMMITLQNSSLQGLKTMHTQQPKVNQHVLSKGLHKHFQLKRKSISSQ